MPVASVLVLGVSTEMGPARHGDTLADGHRGNADNASCNGHGDFELDGGRGDGIPAEPRMVTAIRHLPVPIRMPEGKVGRGHLLPELRSLAVPTHGFVRVPGGASVQYGMIAFLGSTVTPEDMLARWEAQVCAADDRQAALVTLALYATALTHLKIGNTVQIRYDDCGFAGLVKVQDRPPTLRPAPLPE